MRFDGGGASWTRSGFRFRYLDANGEFLSMRHGETITEGKDEAPFDAETIEIVRLVRGDERPVGTYVRRVFVSSRGLHDGWKKVG